MRRDDAGLSSGAALPNDDGLILLAAAVVRQAVIDAARGDPAAADWLTVVRSGRPRRLVILIHR